MAIPNRRLHGRIGTSDRVLSRRNGDIRVISKPCRQQITRLYAIIGAIGNEQCDGAVDLIEKVRQGGRITDLIRGQIGADNLAADEIKPQVQFAPPLCV